MGTGLGGEISKEIEYPGSTTQTFSVIRDATSGPDPLLGREATDLRCVLANYDRVER